IKHREGNPRNVELLRHAREIDIRPNREHISAEHPIGKLYWEQKKRLKLSLLPQTNKSSEIKNSTLQQFCVVSFGCLEM
ncbi:unnamed protein product, partial [Ceratitis capitata]